MAPQRPFPSSTRQARQRRASPLMSDEDVARERVASTNPLDHGPQRGELPYDRPTSRGANCLTCPGHCRSQTCPCLMIDEATIDVTGYRFPSGIRLGPVAAPVADAHSAPMTIPLAALLATMTALGDTVTPNRAFRHMDGQSGNLSGGGHQSTSNAARSPVLASTRPPRPGTTGPESGAG